MLKSKFKKYLLIGVSVLSLGIASGCSGNQESSKEFESTGEEFAEEVSNPLMDLEIIKEQPVHFNNSISIGYIMRDKNSGCQYFVHKKLKGTVSMSIIYDETGSAKGCGDK